MRTITKIKLTCTAALAAAPIGAHAQDIIPPKVYTTTPGGVNVSDGSFVYSVTDLSIGPLTLERHHVTGSRKPNNLFFGWHMTHNFDIYVAQNIKSPPDPPANQAPYKPIVHIGASASGVYAQQHTLAQISRHNFDAERSGDLDWTGGTTFATGQYVYTDRTGAIYTFNNTVPAEGVTLGGSQRVARIDLPDGRIQTFSYNASKQLKLVHDSSGYAIVFDYNAGGDVSAACGFNLAATYVTATSTCAGATLKTTYSYTSGYLMSVVDTTGQTTTYTNAFAGIDCVKPPGYSVCKVAMVYDGLFRVDTQTMADGAVWDVLAGLPDVANDPYVQAFDGDSSGTVTDPDGKVTSFSFTKTSPYAVTDPEGRTTGYRFTGAIFFDPFLDPYHDGTMLEEVIFPEGNRYRAEYTGPSHSVSKETIVAKPGSGLADLVKLYAYDYVSCTPQNCIMPKWIKDPKGNQTDYTYAAFGGLLTEMQPAPTAGAARPLKVNTYVQKYAYIKNSGGTLVAAAAPVWLPNTETVYQTVAGSSSPVCDAGAQQTVTTYEYGANGTANNLRVKGKVVTADGVSLRTCFGYDNQGNKIWETTPRAGLGSCP